MLFLSVLTACYQHEPTHPDGWTPASDEEIVDDSLSFNTSHHYTLNYNFIVVSRALLLIEQEPLEMMSGMPLDTLVVVKDDRLVVADIITLPADSIDSLEELRDAFVRNFEGSYTRATTIEDLE